MKVVFSRSCLRFAFVALFLLVLWLVIHYMTGEDPLKTQVGGDGGSGSILRPKIPEPVEDEAAAAEGLEKTGHPVQVEVFYEALCPDSMNYIVDQLAPTVARLPHDALNVILLPYGKARTHLDGSRVTFSCQHGEEECWGNKLHACGVQQSINQTISVQFVTCLMRHYRRLRQKAPECAEASHLPWRQLSACADGTAIDADMVRYGEMTQALVPRATFIPTITVDGKQDGQASMFGNFLGFVCKAYEARSGKRPSGCP